MVEECRRSFLAVIPRGRGHCRLPAVPSSSIVI